MFLSPVWNAEAWLIKHYLVIFSENYFFACNNVLEIFITILDAILGVPEETFMHKVNSVFKHNIFLLRDLSERLKSLLV